MRPLLTELGLTLALVPALGLQPALGWSATPPDTIYFDGYNRGYEDAYHQFIEPVVGASGDMIGHASRHADRPRRVPETH